MLIGYKNGKKAGYEFQEFQTVQAELAKRQGKIDEYRSDIAPEPEQTAGQTTAGAEQTAAEKARQAEAAEQQRLSNEIDERGAQNVPEIKHQGKGFFGKKN
ncbi:MAG: hypothetical protein LBP76_09475 [Treponema sp.]|jgi:Skp family chaperone for outer membrane proteins|nr:hypothetical protein [Treponema sp.]